MRHVMFVALTLLAATCSRVSIAQPWGSDEAEVLSIFQTSIGLAQPIHVIVHSDLDGQDITYQKGLIRKAGAGGPIDGPDAVPGGTFPGSNHQFTFYPNTAWEVSTLHLIEFEVHTATHWYKTTVVISFDSEADITIWDYYAQSGEWA